MFPQSNDNSDNSSSGNIFGWRISLIGLIIIVVLSAVAAYRHYTLGVPVGFDDPLEQPESRGYYQDKAEREKAEVDSLRHKLDR